MPPGVKVVFGVIGCTKGVCKSYTAFLDFILGLIKQYTLSVHDKIEKDLTLDTLGHKNCSDLKLIHLVNK